MVLVPAVVLGTLAALAASASLAPPAWGAGPSSSPGPSPACTGTLGGLVVSGGSGQVAKAGTAFASPLAAEAVDTGGCPLANVDVEFVAPTSGASATFPGSATTATVATGSNGVADAPSLTANQVSGSYNVLAEVEDTSYQVNFALTNTTSGVPSTIGISSGNDQAAQVGTQFSAPLAVNVLDAFGEPVAGTAVDFTVIPASGANGANGAGASFVGGGASATAQTDQDGTATSPSLVAGTTAGAFTVQASASGVTKTVTFNLTDQASAPYAILPGAGTSQEAQTGTDFAVPLAVTVTDSNGNPVPGAKVTFSAPASGPGGVFAGHGPTATALTNSKGVAVAPSFSANSVAGGYVVTARVAGLASTATFALVNTARTGASTTGAADNYWLATANGQVLSSGAAPHYTAPAGQARPNDVVAMAATPNGAGYWLVTKNGRVYPYGDARSYARATNGHPAAAVSGQVAGQVVGMASTADGHGYWLVTNKGAVYAFGDARYYGAEQAKHLASPIVGIASAPSGKGYWLAAKDGAVYAFGAARYYGAEQARHLASPIVGIAPAPSGKGYWLAAKDGGVFSFGQATFYGSATGLATSPAVAFMPTPDGGGYWVVSANGAVTGFGDAGSQGPAQHNSAQTKGMVVAGAAYR